jgi:hypothetical protein
MADYKTIRNLLSQKGLLFFTFYTKGDKPVKSVIGYLPNKSSSEDITWALQELGYEVISDKQMTAKRPSPEGDVTLVSLPLCFITLVRNQKSLDIFKISSLCNNCQRRDLQVQKWPDSVLQLPALCPHLGPLQAASSLHVVRRWSPPPRMSGEGEHPEYPKLQL